MWLSHPMGLTPTPFVSKNEASQTLSAGIAVQDRQLIVNI